MTTSSGLSTRAIAPVLILACSSVLPGLAVAVSLPQESAFDVEGTISQLSAGKLTVNSGQGIIFHVVYDDKTAIAKADGTAGSKKDLKLGIKVHVVGQLQSSGEIKAERIEIGDEKQTT